MLITRRADPLVIAMIGHEIARRAGIESRVCVAGDDAWTAVLDSENCTLVGAAPLELSLAQESDFHVACPHEAAALLLERLSRRAAGRSASCAASIACALRSGHGDVGVCPGHPRRI